jgi:hypothetical protein
MTNKVVLRSVEEVMADYLPVYQPLYPLFLGKSQSYAEQVGQLTFKRLEAVGDIRAKHITPKDTEIRQLGAKEGSKVFKKYFLANQYVQSSLQDREGIEDVVAQVLDEHQRQMDELFLLGEGTSASTMINNGLFWSNDVNYQLESSDAIASTGGHLPGLHDNIIAQVQVANKIAGRKALIVYGDTALAKFNSVYTTAPVPFKKVLGDVLTGYQQIEMPSDVTPASSDGFIIVNLDQVKLHYTALPSLKDQGVNDEKMYAWHNFLMGSCMLEVLASKAVIRQPLTFS